ncbi:MAG: hypothetical protein HQM15_10370 [Deltaproteobacteria bacterium]|nr:hypothetical protein [Deltaproteobacteria bacterium]
MILKHIQNVLQNLYQLECEHSVENFLLDEEASQNYREKNPWIRQSDEVLYVQQEEENLDIGIFLNPKLLQQFSELNLEQTQAHQISALAPLMEGVSHFVYLLYKSGHEQQVTQLELELQAEIDKFILGNIVWKEKSSEWLMQQLFEGTKWNQELSEKEKERYRQAHRFASKYCSKLRSFFRIEKSLEELCKEIRPFYRMDQSEKLHYIQAL